MPSSDRRSLLRLFIAGAGAAISGPALAQGDERFPTRPVTLWLPWPAGGATDITMRILADGAGRQLGHKMLIENRAGAGGTLVMPVLQLAAPDGYTIAQLPQPVFRAPWIQKLGWDPIRDTTPIIQVSGVTFGIVVPASGALRGVEDLFTWAAANPGRLSVATNGVGTTPHVVMDQLFGERSLRYVHVPYKGTAEQMIAVASGQVMVGVNSTGFAPYVDNGQLRLLATFGERRSSHWPQVPTLKELGYGIVAVSPYGLAGPAGMHAAVVRVLHDALKAAMHEPVHIAELARYDQELAYLGPEDYGRAMRAAFAAEERNVERLGLNKGS
jgi:tripartite-type tricarboxylate transporter receptor subunit TctC